MKHLTNLNVVFAVQLLAVVLGVIGVLPREIFLFSAGLLAFFVLFSSLEESLYLIARSIPLFVALPITESFDSLNVWRIVVLLVFLKWIFSRDILGGLLSHLRRLVQKARQSALGGLGFAWNEFRVETLATLLFAVSVASLVKAEDAVLGVKRIIFFLNLWMLFFVVRAVATHENFRRIAWNAVGGGIIVLAVGLLQLAMAYAVPIDDFAEFWALEVHKTLYGTAWANIAISANTWFAYYNDTIHLRMFSSFPDTHSFPLYLLLMICATMALLPAERGRRRGILIAAIALAAAEVVLSGTRGIWASIVFPILFLGYLWWRRFALRPLVFLPFVLFFTALPLSGLVFGSTQFQLQGTGEERLVLAKRIRSIIDTGETSNQGRIYIWKETLKSIGHNPLLGVGVGNFPTILKLNPTAIKAGASAHNLYLNFLAELGLFGFAIFALVMYEIWRSAWRLFRERSDAMLSFFGLNFLLYFLWILWYSMTDVAIFDERAFLLLMVLTGTVFALESRHGTTPRVN